eukprot:jgi/Chrzof1/8106/UNPLg00151.t1
MGGALLFATLGSTAAAHDYTKALQMSLSFYKAQRSGTLSDNEVPWRRSAFTNDKTADGKDISGGWFDAGDYVNFLLPMSSATTKLAVALAEFWQGYVNAQQLNRALDVLKWGTDFLIKCDLGANRMVGQVGNGQQDHAYWGRPEDVKQAYPVYELSPTKPGADLAGSMAAALAAAATVFNANGNAGYAQKCIASAQRFFSFGTTYPGLYHNSITDAAQFYKSTSQYDDLSLAAATLYLATGQASYKDQAVKLFQQHVSEEQGLYRWPGADYDNNQYMAALLLSRILPSQQQYAQLLQVFEGSWYNARGGIKYTPKGLAWMTEWVP